MTREVHPEDARRAEAFRNHPQYCRVYARRTPLIPFHNGLHGQPCIGCREVIDYTKK